MHPTSFPGKYGIGDFGQEARIFLDFLEADKVAPPSISLTSRVILFFESGDYINDC